MKLFRCARNVVVLSLGVVAVAAAAVVPTLHEPFDTGRNLTDGPVGKASKSKYTLDARGVFNLERGTFAFFYQSVEEPKETEWLQIADLRTQRDAGYWSMAMNFSGRRSSFGFNLFDVGGYAPPLVLPSVFGRWKAGEWHHLTVVWDRNEGIRIYEDGRETASNWGKHQWAWNVLPGQLRIRGPVDEVYVFDVPLTGAQAAQLADGKKPTGTPIPVTDPEQHRAHDLARMGWNPDDLDSIPILEPGNPSRFTFARVNGCIDAKRPVAYPYEGLIRSAWPGTKYGPSIRGRRVQISLDPNQRYDRVRVFTQRAFRGQLQHKVDGVEKPVLDIDAPSPMFWHGQMPETLQDTTLWLTRENGRIGQIDFYRVEPMPWRDRVAKTNPFLFAPADAFPDTEPGRLLRAETPKRFRHPVRGVTSRVSSWRLPTPAFGGFQATTTPPTGSEAYNGVFVELVIDRLGEPLPVRVEIREPVDTERVWLAADVVLQPKGHGTQRFCMFLRGRPVINTPAYQYRKYLGNKRFSDDELIDVPGVGFSVTVTAANAVTWMMGSGGTQLRFSRVDMDTAVETAADDQVEWMREAYAERMEGHAYGDQRIMLPLVWLAHFAPERMEFRQMWERVDYAKPNIVGINIPPLQMPTPENRSGAPDWAFWQMQAVDRIRRHVHWTIDNKQVWTGEFGGVWNDDSTHVENWMGYMLCLDGTGKIRNAMRRYWDGVWTHQLVEGVGKYTQDTCHYSEEGSSGIGMRLLIDYGDPVAYARTLAASSHFDNWLVRNPKDPEGYLLKSQWVGPEGAWTEGAFRVDETVRGHDWDVFVPAGYLIWYNRHPQAAHFIRSIHRGERPPPYNAYGPHGLLGPACDRVTDWDAARKRMAAAVAKPVGRYGPGRGGHIGAGYGPGTDGQEEIGFVNAGYVFVESDDELHRRRVGRTGVHAHDRLHGRRGLVNGVRLAAGEIAVVRAVAAQSNRGNTSDRVIVIDVQANGTVAGAGIDGHGVNHVRTGHVGHVCVGHVAAGGQIEVLSVHAGYVDVERDGEIDRPRVGRGPGHANDGGHVRYGRIILDRVIGAG